MALVANGRAGALMRQGGSAGSLEDKLRGEAASLEVIAEDSGSLPDRMEQAMRTGADCVVVAGGDGSIACAASVLAGTETALGLIPSGTMNLLARDLGLDPDDPDSCLRTLADGQVRSIDAGCVAGTDSKGHLFLCASMLGTPARLSRHREAGRKRGGGLLAWASFGRAAGLALWRNRSLHLTLLVGGQELRRRTPSLTITVNPLDDTSGRMFGRSQLDGGKLVLYVVRRASALRQAWLLLRTVITGSLRAPDVEVIEATELEVHSRHRAVHVLVDGEMRLLAPPLRYTIRPRILRVVAPAAPSGEAAPDTAALAKLSGQAASAAPTDAATPGEPSGQAASGAPPDAAVPAERSGKAVPAAPTDATMPAEPSGKAAPAAPTDAAVPDAAARAEPSGQATPDVPPDEAVLAVPSDGLAATAP